MDLLKFFLVSVVFGIVALMVGHVGSYYLLPKPHLVIGPLLAAAAFLRARKHPRRWIPASVGVSLPFLILAPYSMRQLDRLAAAFNTSITLGDYMIMLSPVGLALIGGFAGRKITKR